MDSQLTTMIVTPLVGGIVGYILAYVKHIAVNKKNELDERENSFRELIENYEKLAKRNDELDKKLEEFGNRLDNIDKKMDNLVHGGKSILRDRIIQSCRHFVELGSISFVARNNIMDMYYWYHDVWGGNGDGEYYYKLMMKLPVDGTPIVSHVDFKQSDEKID